MEPTFDEAARGNFQPLGKIELSELWSGDFSPLPVQRLFRNPWRQRLGALREDTRLQTATGPEFARSLMGLPARERLNAILERTDCDAVVASLAPQDFYVSVQELGPEDALPLLALGSLDQINHLFDVEWWQKDSVVPAKAIEWLDRLARANESRFLAWLHETDFELLVLLFKKWITVGIAREDEDPLEIRDRLSMNTLDDTYYWEVRYPQYEDFVRNLLGMLFEINQGFYRELMNHILYALDVEVEEDAYRFHRGRMEDNAIPDFYDALEIYRPLTQLRAVTKQNIGMLEAQELPVPSFAVALVPESDFLAEILRGVKDPAQANGLQLELAALANKVMIADRLPPNSVDSLKLAVDKAAASVNLGLELACRGDLEEAARCIREILLEDLFRLGHSQGIHLQKKLKKIVEGGWISQWPHGVLSLDPPWREEVELLLEKTPRLPRRLSPSGEVLQADFLRTRRDVEHAGELTKMLQALGPLHRAFRIPWKELESVLWSEAQIRELQDVTLGTLVMTSAAGFIARGTWAPLPLEVKAWDALFPLLEPDVVISGIRKWTSRVVTDSRQRAFVERYLEPLLEDYREEMRKFSRDAPPSPRYIRFFLFSA